MNSLALAGSVPFSLATRVTLYLMDFFVLLGGTVTLCDTDPFEQAILAGSPASGAFELNSQDVAFVTLAAIVTGPPGYPMSTGGYCV